MINLLNNILSRFNLKVVPKQEEPPQQEVSFLDNISEFLKKHPDYLDRYFSAKPPHSLYVGDINYIEDKKTGKTYFQDLRSKNYYCDYDLKNPSKEVLGHMIEGTTFTKEELDEKLKYPKND